MTPEQFWEIMHTAEKLKDVTRHSYTSGGRHESVAEHSWRLALMAFFLRDAFPEVDTDRLIRMCLIHDLGEVFTGDIPSFLKNAEDEQQEEALLHRWVASLPAPYASEMAALYQEMQAQQTPEARIYKALDNMEAVLQHNEAPLSTWTENEYSLNLTYGTERAAFSPVLAALRQALRDETEKKLAARGE